MYITIIWTACSIFQFESNPPILVCDEILCNYLLLELCIIYCPFTRLPLESNLPISSFAGTMYPIFVFHNIVNISGVVLGIQSADVGIYYYYHFVLSGIFFWSIYVIYNYLTRLPLECNALILAC